MKRQFDEDPDNLSGYKDRKIKLRRTDKKKFIPVVIYKKEVHHLIQVTGWPSTTIDPMIGWNLLQQILPMFSTLWELDVNSDLWDQVFEGNDKKLYRLLYIAYGKAIFSMLWICCSYIPQALVHNFDTWVHILRMTFWPQLENDVFKNTFQNGKRPFVLYKEGLLYQPDILDVCCAALIMPRTRNPFKYEPIPSRFNLQVFLDTLAIGMDQSWGRTKYIPKSIIFRYILGDEWRIKWTDMQNPHRNDISILHISDKEFLKKAILIHF